MTRMTDEQLAVMTQRASDVMPGHLASFRKEDAKALLAEVRELRVAVGDLLGIVERNVYPDDLSCRERDHIYRATDLLEPPPPPDKR